MRKLVALVVVLTMVLSSMSMAFAAAPSDLGDYKYADAVKKLVGLGIINGYPDGTFKPTGNITRAEFAKVVVTALGYSDAATASGEAKFSDVVGHWALGYVNVASSLGIINGVGAGKFNPDANVKYEEAVTMIVRALGYEPAAKSSGGYPNGYLTIASQEKITKDVAMVAGTIADRGTVAKLMAESLEVPFLKQTGYGTLTTYNRAVDLKGDATESLLISGLKLKKYVPTVDSYDTAKKELTFTGYDVDGKKVVKYADPIDPVGTENCLVTVWYKDGTIYSFDNETTVKIDRLKEVNGKDELVAGNAADTDILKKVTLQNGGELDAVKDADGDFDAVVKQGDDTFTGIVGNLIGNYAKVYINTDTSEIYRIEAFDLTDSQPGIIASASATEIKYQIHGDNDIYLSNLDEADDLLYVFIDGAQKTLSDLKADMYFESWVNNDGGKVVIAASTAKVTGKLDSYSKDTATIAGTKYDVVGNNVSAGGTKYVSINGGKDYDKDLIDDLDDVDVTAYKNFEGKLAFVKGTATSSTSDFYALVKSYAKEGRSITVVRDVDGVSTEVTYPVKTDSDELSAAYNTSDTNVTWNEFIADSSSTPAGIYAGTYAAGSDITADGIADAAKRIYKFYINSDNKITRIVAQNFGVGSDTAQTGLKFDKDSDYIKSDTITRLYVDGTAFFDLADNKVRYWSKIEGNDGGTIKLGIVPDGNDAEIVAFLGGTYGNVESTDYLYAYVKSVSIKSDIYTLTLANGSTIKFDKDDNDPSARSAEKKAITYVVDGEYVKVKSVANAVYDTADGYVKIENANIYEAPGVDVQYAYGTMAGLDGNNITINVVGSGSGYVGGNVQTTLKLASDATVIRATFKTGSTGAIDEASVSNKTSIANTKKIAVVIVDGLVRTVYYMQ